MEKGVFKFAFKDFQRLVQKTPSMGGGKSRTVEHVDNVMLVMFLLNSFHTKDTAPRYREENKQKWGKR